MYGLGFSVLYSTQHRHSTLHSTVRCCIVQYDTAQSLRGSLLLRESLLYAFQLRTTSDRAGTCRREDVGLCQKHPTGQPSLAAPDSGHRRVVRAEALPGPCQILNPKPLNNKP